MKVVRTRARLRSLAALAAAAGLVGAWPAAPAAAAATVDAVTGSAYGHYASIAMFGTPQPPAGPEPSVSLAPGGGESSTTDVDGAIVQYGPAVFYRSASETVSTSGFTGPTGSVTSSARVAGYQDPAEEPADPQGDGPDPFTWQDLSSTCTATASSTTGSTSVTTGVVVTSTDADGNPATSVPVPPDPAPGTAISGTIDNVGGAFTIVFNEQSAANGVLTVNAAHMYMTAGPAIGEIVYGQSVCGVTVSGAESDLSVTIDDAPDPAVTRGTITYTVTTSNAGPDSGSGAVVVELASGLRLLSFPAGCTETRGKTKRVACDTGSLAAGTSRSFEVVVGTGSRAGSVTTTATVTSATDPNTGNDTASATTAVQRP